MKDSLSGLLAEGDWRDGPGILRERFRVDIPKQARVTAFLGVTIGDCLLMHRSCKLADEENDAIADQIEILPGQSKIGFG